MFQVMAADGNEYYRRNFTLGVINGALINFGLAFFDPATVLPVFVSRLGGSAAMIGLVSAIHGVGWFLPTKKWILKNQRLEIYS